MTEREYIMISNLTRIRAALEILNYLHIDNEVIFENARRDTIGKLVSWQGTYEFALQAKLNDE